MPARPVALVTGASSGIGLELCKLLAADGYDLVLVARSQDALGALADKLQEAHGATCRVMPSDLSDPAAPVALFDALSAEGVEVEVLVNNAGFGLNGVFHELDRQRQVDMVQLNCVALTDLTHLFLPGMVARGKGHVLNIASTAGFQPGPWMSVYYATKAYVLHFSEGIADELKGTGVTVTAHCPGATQTGFGATSGNETSLLFRTGVADAAAVARHAYLSMLNGDVVAIHGPMNWLGAFGVRFGPRALIRAVAGRLNR
ncbi:MAG: SDR family oxidoreductase [Alphaproteobacteria bacterium]|nr:SDR family oxidoreductase [Alphaproteobacteria bacterium]MCB9791191.1 SDR family oxidoreductase [Alphaproteobacteria bacterium]